MKLIEDRDGDGKADYFSTFVAEWSKPLDGLASGVITRQTRTGEDVYVTNIPDLWLLRDTKNSGVADVQQSLSTGYGVRYSLLGHDLHGLRWGPDGKLYYSIGDRGTHVKTREGNIIDLPDEGCVLRCDPDGSNLEVFARGLRNPQKLVFDQYGNLFTGDNNCDYGDSARWVYIIEGGDTGWYRVSSAQKRPARPGHVVAGESVAHAGREHRQLSAAADRVHRGWSERMHLQPGNDRASRQIRRAFLLTTDFRGPSSTWCIRSPSRPRARALR